MLFSRQHLLAIMCLASTSCHRNAADKEAAIAATLGKEAIQWKDTRRIPCIMADVKRSAYDDGRPVAYPLLPSALPKSFKFCSGQYDSYYQIYDPEIAGDRASVELDFKCGSMCGGGSAYLLQRQKAGWKVLEVTQRWVS